MQAICNVDQSLMLPRIGVEAGGLARGGLVGARGTRRLGRLAASWDIVSASASRQSRRRMSQYLDCKCLRRRRTERTGRWWRRSGPRRRRGATPLEGCRRPRTRRLGRLAGGGDVVARVGVEAGGLARGGLVGAG